MTIAAHVAEYLATRGVNYEVVEHEPTASARDAARQAKIPTDQMLKAVLLRDKQGYLLALLPASHRLDLRRMRDSLHRPVRLATETEIAALFTDCELGAIPAIGGAYNLDMIVDDTFAERPELYFDGGDHRSLVHVSGTDFWRLAATARRERFLTHPDQR